MRYIAAVILDYFGSFCEIWYKSTMFNTVALGFPTSKIQNCSTWLRTCGPTESRLFDSLAPSLLHCPWWSVEAVGEGRLGPLWSGEQWRIHGDPRRSCLCKKLAGGFWTLGGAAGRSSNCWWSVPTQGFNAMELRCRAGGIEEGGSSISLREHCGQKARQIVTVNVFFDVSCSFF